TGFNRYFYEKHLPEFGFEIVEVTANGNFFEYAAQEIRRIPEMSKSYAGTKVGRLERWAIKLLLRFLQRCTNQDGGSN
ncbi:MAG: SAM-dependent methyltransferase, partial [Nitrospiraceae bacterium]